MPEILSSIPPSGQKRRKDLVAVGIPALLLFLVFLPGLNYPFLRNWDDGMFVVCNRNLAFSVENFLRYGLEPFQDLCTPLPMYSFMLAKDEEPARRSGNAPE